MKKAILLILTLMWFDASSQVLRKRTVKLMGSRFDFTIIAKDSSTAEHAIDECIAEVTRIENLISDWKSDTEISRVNSNAGISPIKVSAEVFAITKRAITLSKITDGAFDISFAAMDKIWKFDGSMKEMPTQKVIKKSVKNVGYKQIILNDNKSTIFLAKKGMKIGFGALGEGYAADRCRTLMLSRGVEAGIVNGSGDMNTWGKQPDGSDWNIGITDPMRKDTIVALVPLKQGAVVTSGSYEKYVMFDGRRYSHIINPKTGYPATGLSSVTVTGPSAEKANGFSTSIMVLGITKGFKMLEKHPDYHCIVITDDGHFISFPAI